MKEIIQNILSSLDNKQNVGYSGRKLSAFSLMAVIIAVHIKWITLGDFSQLEMVLTIDYAFIATLFGMTTYQNLKNKDENKPS